MYLSMWQIHVVFQMAFRYAYFPLKQHSPNLYMVWQTYFSCDFDMTYLLLCYKCLFSAHKNLVTTHTICGLFSFLWVLDAFWVQCIWAWIYLRSRKWRCFRNWMQSALCDSVGIQWRQVLHLNISGPLAWVGSSIVCCWCRQRAVATVAKGRVRVSTMDSFLHTFSAWENSAVSQAQLQQAKGMTERSTYTKKGK